MDKPPLKTIYRQVDSSYALYRVYAINGSPFRLVEIDAQGVGTFLEMSTQEYYIWTEGLHKGA